jgi:hypothetical protein
MMRIFAVFVALQLPASAFQQRFRNEHPLLSGFAKSPTKHIMNEYPDLLSIRAFRGRITEAGVQDGVPAALIEIKLPSGKVVGARTDLKGSFRLAGIPDGEYLFKVTRDGFQSVFGRLKISKREARSPELFIELKQGI